MKSFAHFWPHYLQAHARPATRALHYVGTALLLPILLLLALRGSAWLMLALPLVGYGFAWVAHFGVEHNRPATFRHPLWSLRADFRMLWRWATGRIGADLADAGVRPDGSVDPARRIACEPTVRKPIE